ncbi:MAG: endonuclease [Sphaerisporangium sp.]|nr:endonuclease [Sphaerisporangium sp.]
MTVTGKHTGRVSLAGLLCMKPGRRTRLLFRTIAYHGRKGEKKGFATGDLIAQLVAAHHTLAAPIVLVWDNASMHTSTAMRTFIADHDWLTVYRLPAYAPDLNPIDTVWAHLKGHLTNLACRTLDEMLAIIKNRLKRMQYQPDLLSRFILGTPLGLNPP